MTGFDDLRRDFGYHFGKIKNVDTWRREVRGKDGVHFRSFMALCAFRYALGRMTFIVGMVCDEIRRELSRIDNGDLERMVNEITEADERGGLGMDCDRREWLRLRGEIKEELGKSGHKL